MEDPPKKILVIDDESVSRVIIGRMLEKLGFTVITSADGAAGLELYRQQTPDLIMVDLFMPDIDGFKVLTTIQAQSPETPVILISATDRIGDVIRALRLGAWDYLTKDVTTLDFLPARISAMFRTVEIIRSGDDTNKKVIEHDNLRIDEDRKEVFWQEKPVILTLTEFWILLSVARRPGNVKTHDQLMEAANVVVTNNAIAAHIRRIRDKFRENDPSFDSIRSEYGMGYRWYCV